MPSILILGGAGMLGHKMFQVLRERFSDTVCTIRGSVDDDRHRKIELLQNGGVVQHVDASDMLAVDELLRERQPDVVVNCVGIIKQRSNAHAAIPSLTLNALLPHRLGQVAAEWNGRVIHFSTDCVFNGRRGRYTEADQSDAEDLYGRTKFLGEVSSVNAVTLRTSIIGRELHQFTSLLEWFLSQKHTSVRGFTQAIYSGVTTNELAKVVSDLIEKQLSLSGVYQVVSEPISKYDLLTLVRSAYDLDIDIIPDDRYACDRSMVGERFHQATGYICPPWRDLIDQLAADPTPYISWR